MSTIHEKPESLASTYDHDIAEAQTGDNAFGDVLAAMSKEIRRLRFIVDNGLRPATKHGTRVEGLPMEQAADQVRAASLAFGGSGRSVGPTDVGLALLVELRGIHAQIARLAPESDQP